MKKFLKNIVFTIVFVSVISFIAISKVNARPISKNIAGTYCTDGGTYNACQNFGNAKPSDGEILIYTFDTNYIVYDLMANAGGNGACISETNNGIVPNSQASSYCFNSPSPDFNETNQMVFGLVNTYNYVGNTTSKEWLNFEILLPDTIYKDTDYKVNYMFAIDTSWSSNDESTNIKNLYGRFDNALSDWKGWATDSNSYIDISSYVSNLVVTTSSGSLPLNICHNSNNTSFNEYCSNVTFVIVEFNIRSSHDLSKLILKSKSDSSFSQLNFYNDFLMTWNPKVTLTINEPTNPDNFWNFEFNYTEGLQEVISNIDTTGTITFESLKERLTFRNATNNGNCSRDLKNCIFTPNEDVGVNFYYINDFNDLTDVELIPWKVLPQSSTVNGGINETYWGNGRYYIEYDLTNRQNKALLLVSNNGIGSIKESMQKNDNCSGGGFFKAIGCGIYSFGKFVGKGVSNIFNNSDDKNILYDYWVLSVDMHGNHNDNFYTSHISQTYDELTHTISYDYNYKPDDNTPALNSKVDLVTINYTNNLNYGLSSSVFSSPVNYINYFISWVFSLDSIITTCVTILLTIAIFRGVMK